MLVIMTFAAMLLFALVGDGEPDLLSYDESAAAGDRGRAYYPHPTVRVMHVDAQLERFSRFWWLRGDRRLTLRAMVQAVRLARSGVRQRRIALALESGSRRQSGADRSRQLLPPIRIHAESEVSEALLRCRLQQFVERVENIFETIGGAAQARPN